MLEMLVCLLVLATVADLMTDRIPNALTLTGLVAALWHGFVRAGPAGFLSAVWAAGVMFVICFLLFLVKALRGGDGKLLSVLSGMLGLTVGGRILLGSLVIAAGIGIVAKLIKKKKGLTQIHYSIPILLAALLQFI